MGIGSIIKAVAYDRKMEILQSKGRIIDRGIYRKLKKLRKCQRCGKKKGILEIHHKTPLSKGGNNNEENLMAVCCQCHKDLDREAGVRVTR